MGDESGTRKIPCHVCDGDGWVEAATGDPEWCQNCHGTGEVDG